MAAWSGRQFPTSSTRGFATDSYQEKRRGLLRGGCDGIAGLRGVACLRFIGLRCELIAGVATTGRGSKHHTGEKGEKDEDNCVAFFFHMFVGGFYLLMSNQPLVGRIEFW